MILQAGVCLEQRYLLLKVIGQGGTSTVFLALDKKIQRHRAVKAVKKEWPAEAELWRQECRILKKLHHENLVEIYDMLENEEYVFLIMEYVEGYSAKQWLDRGKHFSVEQVIGFGIQICRVLSYLHNQKPPVIYRDLKPSNLMISEDQQITLIDFGTAREYQKLKDEDTVFWGTVGYAAPEQMERRGQTDARTDIYSLGVTLFEMAFGEKFSRKRVEYPVSALEEIVEVCTRNEQDKRYQTAEELEENLENHRILGKKNRRRRQMKKWLLLLVWSSTILLFSLSWMLRWQAKRLLTEGYEKYLQAGDRKTEAEERVWNLQAAICINPWKPEAYLALLDEYRGQGFGQRAYTDFLEVLSRTTDQGISYEECLKQSPMEYGEFAYQMGIACYFEWEGDGNKKYALPWLQTAGQSDNLPPQEKELALCLEKIAGYHARMERQERTDGSSYREYWEDLKKMLEMPGTDQIQQMVEKEIAGQILRHVQDFAESGVSEEELTGILEEIRKRNEKLEHIISEGEKAVQLVYHSA